jgi:hypothetical protein
VRNARNKMASVYVPLVCYECGKEIIRKDYITCIDCSYHFHLDCTSIGEKLFYLMTSDSRKKCKCDSCKRGQCSNNIVQVNVPTDNSFSSLLEHECSMANAQDLNIFVTQRRNRKRSLPDLSASFISMNSSSHQTMKNSNSLPDFSLSENLSEKELKLEIKRLQTELDVANHEIENLNVINTQLNKKNQEQEKLIKLYKNITIDDVNSIRTTNIKNSYCMSTPLRIPMKKISGNESEPRESLSNENIPPIEVNKSNTGCLPTINNKAGRKICLITSVYQDRKSSKLSDHFAKGFSCCHYRTPGGGIEQLSDGLQEKLINFTMNDFCILMVGETDFNISKNYKKLVHLLKQRISGVKHTNIIVCLPTFKCNNYCNLFNKRIELFNRMFYRDNEINEYCYILDSNNNLEYSYKMFSKYSGKLNLNGLKIVLSDLDYLVNYIIFDIIEYSEQCMYDCHYTKTVLSHAGPVLQNVSFRT